MSDHLACYRPAHPNLKAFPGQNTDEHVQLMIRKHWIIDLAILCAMFFGTFWPFIIYAIASFIWVIPNTTSANLIFVLMHLYSLFALFFYYVKWIDHRFDLIILTDRRMVDINQDRLFNRKVSEANLAQIQDVASEIKGFWGSMLNFGSLNIQTAGADGKVFEMHYVRWPSLVASNIIELRDNYTRAHHIKENPTPIN